MNEGITLGSIPVAWHRPASRLRQPARQGRSQPPLHATKNAWQADGSSATAAAVKQLRSSPEQALQELQLLAAAVKSRPHALPAESSQPASRLASSALAGISTPAQPFASWAQQCDHVSQLLHSLATIPAWDAQLEAQTEVTVRQLLPHTGILTALLASDAAQGTPQAISHSFSPPTTQHTRPGAYRQGAAQRVAPFTPTPISSSMAPTPTSLPTPTSTPSPIPTPTALLRSLSRILASWAKLGASPRPTTLLGLLQASIVTMQGISSPAANPPSLPLQPLHISPLTTQPSHVSQSSTSGQQAGPQAAAPALTPPVAPHTSPSHHPSDDSKGIRPIRPLARVRDVRKEEVARALVDLTEALALLLPPGALAQVQAHTDTMQPHPTSPSPGASPRGQPSMPHLPVNVAALLAAPQEPLGVSSNNSPAGGWTSPTQRLMGLHMVTPTAGVSRFTGSEVAGTAAAPMVLAAWSEALQVCSQRHLRGFNASGLARLLQACAGLQLPAHSTWLHSVGCHMVLTAPLTPPDTPHRWLLPAPAHGRATAGRTWQRRRPLNPPLEELVGVQPVVQHSQSALNSLAAQLEALAWLVTCTPAAQQRASWLQGAGREPWASSGLLQVLSSLLTPSSVHQWGPERLAPLFWAAAILSTPPTACMVDHVSTSAQPEVTSTQPAMVTGTQAAMITGTQPAASMPPSEPHTGLDAAVVHATLEQLHGHLVLLPPRRLVQALHGSAVLGVRPYAGWLAAFDQQVLRHHAAFDKQSALMLVWSRARVHGPGLTPASPMTTVLVSILAHHVPAMSLGELQAVEGALGRMYARSTGKPLQRLLLGIKKRRGSARAAGVSEQ